MRCRITPKGQGHGERSKMIGETGPRHTRSTALRTIVAFVLLLTSVATTTTPVGAQTAPEADISLGVGASNYRNSNDVRLRMGCPTLVLTTRGLG